MTSVRERKAAIDLIYICKCAVKGIAPSKEYLMDLEIDLLYQEANRHMLSAVVGSVLINAGIEHYKFEKAVALAQRGTVVFDYELGQVISELEQAGIWYMPLKGAVLKNYYPCIEMREMCDIDILIDAERAEDVRTIMERLGYETKSFGLYNDDDYLKPPMCYFEMHRSLFGDMHDRQLYEYYKDIKSKLLKDEGNECGYHFSPEDFYIFMIAHEYKHYNLAGTGLRSLLDTYIYLNASDLDMKYVTAETDKLGITEYEQKNRSLALKLFDGQELSEEESRMMDYIVSSGTYGIYYQNIGNRIEKAGGTTKYLLRRFWGPLYKNDQYYGYYKRRYPLFYKYPIMLPLLPFYRLYQVMKKNPGKIKAEINILRKSK